eukprot:GEMP01020378.1.p1 GENE.GEMP01020378.1~~GEMP01020378.1.p1  ORF type:complete len:610 (+),score=104.73 GEMP01020378.1:2-1831(+)
MEDLYPVAVLIDELKHDELSLRIRAVSALDVIAQALKPERTREELIPFIASEIVDDDDEMLAVLAEKLGEFIPYVGGPTYAYVLLPPLEELACSEESTVRLKATAGLVSLVTQMSIDSIDRYFMPLIRRLQEHDWYTARISALSLIEPTLTTLKTRAEQDASDLSGDAFIDINEVAFWLYEKLCSDDTPMVRRAAMQVFPDIMKHDVRKARMAPFQRLCDDDQDGVRVITVANCVQLGALSADMFGQVMPILAKCSVDKSWRVRYMLADAVGDLCQTYYSKMSELMPLYMQLLEDPEIEVRTCAITRLADIAKLNPTRNFLHEMMPVLDTLSKESSEYVRKGLAGVLLSLAPIFGAQLTADCLMMVFLTLIRDENAEVRLKLISTIACFASVVGVDLLTTSLLPAILDLAEDIQWRIRLAILELTPDLAKQLGQDVFCDKIESLYAKWMVDPVCSVRLGAAKNIRGLVDVLGAIRCLAFILPILQAHVKHTNYLHRVTVLNTCATLGECIDETDVLEHLFPLFHHLLVDPIPNVRFNVARALKTIGQVHRGPAVSNKMMTILNKLADEDSDKDVMWFASESRIATTEGTIGPDKVPPIIAEVGANGKKP